MKKASSKKTVRKQVKKTTVKRAARSSVKKTTKASVKKVVRKKAAKPASKSTSTRPAAKVAKAAKAPAAKTVNAAPRIKAIKTHLTPKELRLFREMLLEKRRQLLGDMSGMEQQAIGEHGAGNLSSLPTHMADVGTDNFEHEFTLGLLESEQSLLREIDEQLQRIEEKTYGMCLGTGDRIPKARLKAKPWAKYTVEFTRMLEKGLVRPPDSFADLAEEE